MLCDFPKILSELRRARGISQKKAASELGISPALLSHYENGIRECGLDFLLRLSEYYSVSCDYLLGKSTIKNPVVYETEPEAAALDSILKIAKEHNEQIYDLLCRVARVESYRMARSLCDTASRSNLFTFRHDGHEYRDIANGVVGCLYTQLSSFGKERKRLPHTIPDKYSEIIALAENELEKYFDYEN